MAFYTPTMFAFFKARTDRHIQFFNDCMSRLMLRPVEHDHSKYREPEMTGYVLLTWSKAFPDSLTLDDGHRLLMDNAVRTHLLSNSHHPEYWDPLAYLNKQVVNASEMDALSLQEMVCDWAAMSLEFGDNAAEFAKKNIGRRWLFNSEQEALIYAWLEALDYRLGPAPPKTPRGRLTGPRPPALPSEREFDRAMNNHPQPETE